MTEYDAFIDYCESEGLDPEEEDFDAWRYEQIMRAEDAAAERFMDHMRERAEPGSLYDRTGLAYNRESYFR